MIRPNHNFLIKHPLNLDWDSQYTSLEVRIYYLCATISCEYLYYSFVDFTNIFLFFPGPLDMKPLKNGKMRESFNFESL